jgi:hypothetical protein
MDIIVIIFSFSRNASWIILFLWIAKEKMQFINTQQSVIVLKATNMCICQYEDILSWKRTAFLYFLCWDAGVWTQGLMLANLPLELLHQLDHLYSLLSPSPPSIFPSCSSIFFISLLLFTNSIPPPIFFSSLLPLLASIVLSYKVVSLLLFSSKAVGSYGSDGFNQVFSVPPSRMCLSVVVVSTPRLLFSEWCWRLGLVPGSY